MADTEEKKTSNKKRKAQNKVRVKLPGIESYEKELEFTAEGPGRVVVRLERLMGSDRIRITDPKYLATLVERLESEEAQAWLSRSRLRKKAEKNRSRQLAIDGLMEPTEDMQDLYNHPVFRVNRVLNRLALFDQNMAHAGSATKLPPIHAVEPFCDDDSGAVFKSYSGHGIIFDEDLENYSSPSEPSAANIVLGKSKADIIMQAKLEAKKSLALQAQEEEEEEEEEEEDEEEGEEEEGTQSGAQPSLSVMKLEELPAQLSELQALFGVSEDEDLVKNWQLYRSNFVDVVFETDDAGSSLYAVGEDVAGLYARQYEEVSEYVEPREQEVEEMLITLAKPPSQPINPAMVTLNRLHASEKPPEPAEEEDEEEKLESEADQEQSGGAEAEEEGEPSEQMEE